MEAVLHVLGLCGENHPRMLDLIPIYSYLTEYRTAFAYTLRNTWQYFNIF